MWRWMRGRQVQSVMLDLFQHPATNFAAGGELDPGTISGCRSSSGASARRQRERAPRALPRRAVDGDVAAHSPGEPAGDVEAEAGAARLGRIDPLELLEDPDLILGRDALALVGDDERREVAFAVAADPHLAAFGRVADRVGEEVDDDLQRPAEIAPGGQALAARGSVDPHLPLPRADGEQAGGPAGDVGQVDLLPFGMERSEEHTSEL